LRRVLLSVLTALLVASAQAVAACNSCSTDEQIPELPDSCLQQVELIVANSVAYPPTPENLKKVLPFVRQANEAAYRCKNYDVAVGKDLTVIVDRNTGYVYLTHYVFQPEER